MDEIRLWMLERFRPIILVASTSAVEQVVVERNGLSLVDLLRAFRQIPRLDGKLLNAVTPMFICNSHLQAMLRQLLFGLGRPWSRCTS
jgi:hypothetical protein